MLDIIVKKRNGIELSKAEIEYFIKGYVAGEIPDYQAAALLMAIYFKKLTVAETFEFTNAMRYSGDNIDLSPIHGIKVDKHSTGGVGDKTTFIVGPVASACGVPIAKMSGRGLGITGGTVDKLESIPGFKTSLEPAEFMKQVSEIGIALIGQTGHITPADKKIYALRDVTGTVENMGLIASSIMSKKLASGSDAIVLDVKCGNGAFMTDIESARELSKLMCQIGNSAGRKTVAMITDMNQPLGNAVGNSLEVIEAMDVLKGKGPADITELSAHVAGAMIYLGERAKTMEEGILMARQAMASGAGLEKLRSLIRRQGGDDKVIDDYSLLPVSKIKADVIAQKGGYVESIVAGEIGLASQRTGAGRMTKEDEIDHGAGIVLHKKVGDKVTKGESLATLYSGNKKKMAEALKIAEKAFEITKEKPDKPVLIKDVIKE